MSRSPSALETQRANVLIVALYIKEANSQFNSHVDARLFKIRVQTYGSSCLSAWSIVVAIIRCVPDQL